MIKGLRSSEDQNEIKMKVWPCQGCQEAKHLFQQVSAPTIRLCFLEEGITSSENVCIWKGYNTNVIWDQIEKKKK